MNLFSCASASPRAPRRRTAGRPASALAIDIHCHVHLDPADALVAPFRRQGQEPLLTHVSAATVAHNRVSIEAVRGKLRTLGDRLADMDAQDVDLQVISPSPFQYFYWAPDEVARETSRMINDWVADQVGRAGDRFAGMCTVPLQNTAFAVEEIERAVRVLGLKAVEIGTTVGGEELSSERLRPFFARAEALGVLIFVHPSGFADGDRMASHNLINIVGNPLETTLAVSHLIFDGTLKDMPGLKICLAHGGGYLPMYAGRMDHAHGMRPDCRHCIDEPPSTFLRKFYFDSVVYDRAHLEAIVRKYGADRVLLGTDYPYDMGEPDPVGLVAASSVLSDEEKAAVLGGNAATLLDLDEHVLDRLLRRRAAFPADEPSGAVPVVSG